MMGLLKVSDGPNEGTDRIIRIGPSNEAISVGEIAKDRNRTPRRAVLRLEEVSTFCHITGKAAVCWWQDEYWNTPDRKEGSSSADVDIEPLAIIVDKRANAILAQETESWKTQGNQGWRSWLWGVQIITPDVASRSSVAVRLRGGADSTAVQIVVGSSEDGSNRKAAYDKTLGTYSPEGGRQYYRKVWFRKEVLNKYYQDERYIVEQLTVQCGNQWSIRCDTEASPTAVWTYWGDLAALPEAEALHWAAYSIPPRTDESEAAYRAFTTGHPPTTDTPRREVMLLRRQVDEAWNRLTGVPLYTKLDNKDERELQVVRVQRDLSEGDIGKITLALDKVAIDTLRPGKNAKERRNLNRLEVLTRHVNELLQDESARDAVHRGIQELRRVRARRHQAAHARTREPQGDTPRTAHDVVTGTIHGLRALLEGLEREIGARSGVGGGTTLK